MFWGFTKICAICCLLFLGASSLRAANVADQLLKRLEHQVSELEDTLRRIPPGGILDESSAISNSLKAYVESVVIAYQKIIQAFHFENSHGGIVVQDVESRLATIRDQIYWVGKSYLAWDHDKIYEYQMKLPGLRDTPSFLGRAHEISDLFSEKERSSRHARILSVFEAQSPAVLYIELDSRGRGISAKFRHRDSPNSAMVEESSLPAAVDSFVQFREFPKFDEVSSGARWISIPSANTSHLMHFFFMPKDASWEGFDLLQGESVEVWSKVWPGSNRGARLDFAVELNSPPGKLTLVALKEISEKSTTQKHERGGAFASRYVWVEKLDWVPKPTRTSRSINELLNSSHGIRIFEDFNSRNPLIEITPASIRDLRKLIASELLSMETLITLVATQSMSQIEGLKGDKPACSRLLRALGILRL